jgi:hypothetical protein
MAFFGLRKGAKIGRFLAKKESENTGSRGVRGGNARGGRRVMQDGSQRLGQEAEGWSHFIGTTYYISF